MSFNFKFKEPRKEVAYFMRRLYKRGLTTTSGGNISFRINENVIAITSASTDKGRLKWKEVGLVRLDGDNLTSQLKPSMEVEMHLCIYRKSPGTNAIIHAHPPVCSSYTATGRTIDTNLTAEARVILGVPKFAPYALMGSKELAELVSDIACSSQVVLMENHGVLSIGSSLLQAFDRIEVLEMAAKMNVIVDLIGEKRALNENRLRELDKIFG
jgi:L-fuculose-phosphate aldolase